MPGNVIPVPDVASNALVGDGHGLQPRPGTMPGLYILQVAGDFYHYGGPLETGADPQSTAHYDDTSAVPVGTAGTSGFVAGTLAYTNRISGAQLWH
jgi:hypothetical protein